MKKLVFGFLVGFILMVSSIGVFADISTSMPASVASFSYRYHFVFTGSSSNLSCWVGVSNPIFNIGDIQE